MFLSGEDQRHDFVRSAFVALLAPADDVHAWLAFAFGDGQGTVEPLAEDAVRLLGHGADDEYGAGIVFQQEEAAALAGVACVGHFLCLAARQGKKQLKDD